MRADPRYAASSANHPARHCLKLRLMVAAVLVGAIPLAGCGSADSDEEVSSAATRADLPAMVLPKRALGDLAQGLEVTRDSGWIDNK